MRLTARSGSGRFRSDDSAQPRDLNNRHYANNVRVSAGLVPRFYDVVSELSEPRGSPGGIPRAASKLPVSFGRARTFLSGPIDFETALPLIHQLIEALE